MEDLREPPETVPVSFGEAFRFWLKLGFISFGGPTGQIAILHQEVVERRRWVAEDRFLHALNFCMLLPGPEAQQLASCVGWMLHGTRGAIVAGSLFVLPSVVILFGLGWAYLRFGDVAPVAAALAGLRPAVVAIVAAALFRIARRTLGHPARAALAVVALVALRISGASFPFVVLAAAGIGFLGARLGIVTFRGAPAPRAAHDEAPHLPRKRPLLRRAVRVLAVALLLWAVPLAALAAWRGRTDLFVEEALFFTKAAMVTIGGAYAVLPYVAQRAVEDHGWLSATQMIDGLGLAETTPGPLIMVLQFVGHLAGANGAPELGVRGEIVGALVATYFTFLPSFVWILLAAPSIDGLRRHAAISGAMIAVTSAVVGVMANLALWFGEQVLFPRVDGALTFDVRAGVVAGLALFALVRLGWGMPAVVGGAAALSLAFAFFR